MSDEERRALERSARYDSGVVAFLECMREGHLPAFRGVDLRGSIIEETNDGGILRDDEGVFVAFCRRCKLVYWEAGPRSVVADTQTELALLENDLLAKRNPPVPVPANATLALVANKDGTTSLTVSQ